MAKNGIEEWAASVVEHHLGFGVEINDDNSAPSMYDLRIGPATAPDYAIEVVGAVDPGHTMTWNTGPAKGSLQMPLTGTWRVELEPGTKPMVPKFRAGLEQALKEMEALGVTKGVSDDVYDEQLPSVTERLKRLGVSRVDRLQTGSGTVHLTMAGFAAVVDDTGSAFVPWLKGFLLEPSKADVIYKLSISGGVRKEAFIPVEPDAVPPVVAMYLTSATAQLPGRIPSLPNPLTGAWVCVVKWDQGLYWDGRMWHFVATSWTSL